MEMGAPGPPNILLKKKKKSVLKQFNHIPEQSATNFYRNTKIASTQKKDNHIIWHLIKDDRTFKEARKHNS